MSKQSMSKRKMPLTSSQSGHGDEALPDLYRFTVQIVNICFIGSPAAPQDWILLDAGMPGSRDDIIDAAEQRFGSDCKPQHILMTHGHFDHVGALRELAEHWDVPIYAHAQELPYLRGEANYPPPDSRADSGLVNRLSPMFPHSSVDVSEWLQALPEDGSVPGLPEWRTIHTPGHTPGHVSFFRDRDKALLAGDAFVTVRQESLYKVLTQQCEISGPPRYFTPDWAAAKASVQRLNELRPELAITGHGLTVQGNRLTRGLDDLARNFDRLAVPAQERPVE